MTFKAPHETEQLMAINFWFLCVIVWTMDSSTYKKCSGQYRSNVWKHFSFFILL